MFTIERKNEKNETYTTTKETIEDAQKDAKNWMNYWKSTVVYYTTAPNLIIFSATQFIIIKETL